MRTGDEDVAAEAIGRRSVTGQLARMYDGTATRRWTGRRCRGRGWHGGSRPRPRTAAAGSGCSARRRSACCWPRSQLAKRQVGGGIARRPAARRRPVRRRPSPRTGGAAAAAGLPRRLHRRRPGRAPGRGRPRARCSPRGWRRSPSGRWSCAMWRCPGAQSDDLERQVALLLADTAPSPGRLRDHDRRERRHPPDAARPVGAAVCPTRCAGCARRAAEVVVGTCPDLGTIEPVYQPLRWLARRAEPPAGRRADHRRGRAGRPHGVAGRPAGPRVRGATRASCSARTTTTRRPRATRPRRWPCCRRCAPRWACGRRTSGPTPPAARASCRWRRRPPRRPPRAARRSRRRARARPWALLKHRRRRRLPPRSRAGAVAATAPTGVVRRAACRTARTREAGARRAAGRGRAARTGRRPAPGAGTAGHPRAGPRATGVHD